MPLISILTPVWNGMPYIEECVASVRSQAYGDWEMVISDNGSTDGSRDYLDSLEESRIRIYKQERNLGIFGNLNFLFSEARGPIVYILCADDRFLPGALERISKVWGYNEDDVGAIFFNHRPPRALVHCGGFARRSLPARVEPNESAIFFFLFGNLAGNLSNVSARRSAVEAMGGFREDLPFAGDGDMWGRMAQKFPFVIEDAMVSDVRRHAGVASVYLNLKGELIGQQRHIALALFEQIKNQYPKWLLRVHATIIYEAQHRPAAIKRLIKERKATYLRCVDARTDGVDQMLLGVGWGWFFCLLTIGGRCGRFFIPYILLKFFSPPNRSRQTS